ncbi:hypothetical protein [Nitratifractor salsuginis]|uniref:Uncharacterized protein n=1 Tax=Nitratifractor salsuginis (strain DSM 16511 / JCM 12458 / E9I37-1) TaxID=749222 RepID=E6X2T7_NITSE|nr:hypothetical protein [Nitratifractor salsuginis]ADV47220.1 hypothetical protein Nitsa_1977 [Nitratifractor salsuginis DSM 16511]
MICDSVAEHIRECKITQWEEIVEDRDFFCVDRSEKCHEVGYNNDGYSLAMAAGIVKRGYL